MIYQAQGLMLFSQEISQDFSAIRSLEVNPKSAKLDNPFAYSQTVAMAKLSNGQIIDATRSVNVVVHGDAVKISSSGLVEPVKNGSSIFK